MTTHTSSLVLTRLVWLAMGALIAAPISGLGFYIVGKQQSQISGNEAVEMQQRKINETQAQIIYDLNGLDNTEFMHKYAD